MAFLAFDLEPQWAASARFTSTGNTPLEVVNPATSLGLVHYVVTDTDAIPNLPVAASGSIRPGDKHSIGLLDQERLWLASSLSDARATVNY